jgi:hypothetical protein
MFVERPGGQFAAALGTVLPVVSLPAGVVEVRARSIATPAPTTNAHELSGTNEIRRFAKALEQDVDRALVLAARGEFAGITLSLAASTQEVRTRTRHASRAHSIRTASGIETARRDASRSGREGWGNAPPRPSGVHLRCRRNLSPHLNHSTLRRPK